MKIGEYINLVPIETRIEIIDANDIPLATGTAEDIDRKWNDYDVGRIVPGVIDEIVCKGVRVTSPITTIII